MNGSVCDDASVVSVPKFICPSGLFTFVPHQLMHKPTILNSILEKTLPIFNLFHVSLPRSQITSISTVDEMNAVHIVDVDKDISLTLFCGTF